MPIDSCVSSFSLPTFLRMKVAFETSYECVNQAAKQYAFLLSPAMKNQFQSLYNACAEHSIHDMYVNGRLPNFVIAEYKKNAKENFNYLQLTANGCRLTVSSYNHKPAGALPRPSIFRKHQSFENQTHLSKFWGDNAAVTSYGILLHARKGARGLASPELALGIPDNDYKSWLGYSMFYQILPDLEEIPQEENEYMNHLKNEISRKVAVSIKSMEA